jgi:hypothetical protein
MHLLRDITRPVANLYVTVHDTQRLDRLHKPHPLRLGFAQGMPSRINQAAGHASGCHQCVNHIGSSSLDARNRIPMKMLLRE